MDWPKFAQRLLLDNGRIDELEAKLLRRAILEDGVIDREEVEFLVALKRQAVTIHPRFDELLFDVLKRAVLSDGVITDADAEWLRGLIFADAVASAAERALVAQLRTEAKSTGAGFKRLHNEVMRLEETDMWG